MSNTPPSATPTPATPPEDSVAGERSISVAHRARSIQSRLNSVLAMVLMGALGLGLLGWYYSGAVKRPARMRDTAQTAAANRAKGEMPLPALGKIQQPIYPIAEENRTALESLLGPRPALPPGAIPAWASSPSTEPVASPKPQQSAFERRLKGPVLSAGEAARAPAPEARAYSDSESPEIAHDGDSELSARLKPSITPVVLARTLPTQRWLLPKGAFIDCTLETAIDSTLPGMATCITATDTFGADGQIVLLERGTKLVGETQSRGPQGSARVFVLWTEARTPTGVVVPLASPGTDELGRSGLPGSINRHFWDRFGAALLISTIEGVVETSTRSSGGDTIIFNPSRSTDVATEVLKSTADIRPTIIKNQGDRIQVLVARDLDFRNVYELRAAAASR